MALVKPAIGQSPWGDTLNAALDSLQAQITALSSVLFDLPGTLTASTSPAIPALQAFQASALAVTLGTPGSDDTTVELLRNGFSVGTVIVPASESVASATFPAATFEAGDTYAVRVTAVGPGAADLGGAIGVTTA